MTLRSRWAGVCSLSLSLDGKSSQNRTWLCTVSLFQQVGNIFTLKVLEAV